MAWKFRVIQRKFSVFFKLFGIHFFQNLFELLCLLSENTAKMRTNADKKSEKIRQHFFARVQNWKSFPLLCELGNYNTRYSIFIYYRTINMNFDFKTLLLCWISLYLLDVHAISTFIYIKIQLSFFKFKCLVGHLTYSGENRLQEFIQTLLGTKTQVKNAHDKFKYDEKHRYYLKLECLTISLKLKSQGCIFQR